jgi:hypothetical protein
MDVDKSKDAAVCSHCGTAFVVEKAISNYNSTINAQVVNKTVNIYGGDQADFVIRAGTLERYNGAATDVVVPDGVTAIGDECFINSQITSVVFPDSLKVIGKESFRRCKNLKSVVLPDSVVSVGDYAFADCSSLEQLVVPESVTSIGVGAFACIATATDEVFAHLAKHKRKAHKKESSRNLTAIIILIVVIILYNLFRRYFFW